MSGVRTLRPAAVIGLIMDGPLTPPMERAALAEHGRTLSHSPCPVEDAGASGPAGLVGAALRFEGIVRRAEPGEDGERDLVALDYQTYDPMAERELCALARSVAGQHGLLSCIALHSRGRVNVGEASFILLVESPHRAEALAAMADFIDRLKRDVPIWKRPVWQ